MITFVFMIVAVIMILAISDFYQFGYKGSWDCACFLPEGV
jgi:hypothetical protein